MDYSQAAPVTFTASGATAEEQDENLSMVKGSPGYAPATAIVAEAIHKDADVTVLDFTPQQVNVRFRIDGLWHPGMPMDRQTGDYMLAVVKQLGGADYRDRRSKQTGKFQTEYLRQKQKFKVVSQGVQTGERVALYLDYKKPPLDSLEDLGMRPSMVPQVVDLMRMDNTSGWFLVSAIPGDGYTTGWRGALDSCDRLVRDFYVIEEAKDVEPEVINVSSVTFDSSKGETALTPLPQLILREPDVLAFPALPNGKMLDGLCDISLKHEIPCYFRHQGKNAIDALLRTIALGLPDPKKFVDGLTGVLCMRLIRKLCTDCRMEYAPHPQLLQKLGLPPGRIERLYRPFVFKPGMVDENQNEIDPCPTCSGIGYKGRTGVFELLKMTDAVKSAAKKSPTMATLVSVAKQERHINLTQEASVLIAKGTTSVEELQRMLQS